MTNEEFFKTKGFKEGVKVLLVVVGFALIISIWRSGVTFGHWLYEVLH
jgi:hypothetical protein